MRVQEGLIIGKQSRKLRNLAHLEVVVKRVQAASHHSAHIRGCAVDSMLKNKEGLGGGGGGEEREGES